MMLIHVCLFPKTVTYGLERGALNVNVTPLKAKAILWLIKVLRENMPAVSMKVACFEMDRNILAHNHFKIQCLRETGKRPFQVTSHCT